MHKIFVALLTVMLIYLQSRLWIGDGSVSEIISLRERIEQERLKSDRLFQRNRQLANEVVELQKGLGMIEKEARQELGMVKRDETFYLIYD